MAGHPGNGDHALLWVVFALVLVLLLVVLVSLVLDYYRRSNEPQPGENVPPPGGAALEILDTRYAGGELTRRDYLQARGLFGAGEAPAPAA